MPRAFPHALRLPLVAAPMFLVTGPELVLAACKAGIVGAFPTPNARNTAILDEWMRKITDGLAEARAAAPGALIGPWAANLVTHSSNPRLPQDLELIAKYKPPIVITALGSPKPAIEVVHSYGGLVFGDVVNLKLAHKAAEAGVDGMACVSAGAGGHTGTLSPFAFISAIREFFDGTVVVGGGIADGWGVAGAIAAGADLVYMGTRFIATPESIAVPAYKQMVTECNADDLVISAGITGTPAIWLKPSLRANGYDPDDMPAAPPKVYDGDQAGAKRWADLWAAGQGVGRVKAVHPVAAIVNEIESEYRAATRRMANIAAAQGAPITE